MTELCETMQLLIQCFEGNSKKEGDKEFMTKRNVVFMLREEFPNINPMHMAEMEKIFKDLDADGDGGVDFKEFVAIVTELAMMSTDLDITNSSDDMHKETKLRRTMQLLMKFFKEYSAKEGNPDTMTKKQVVDMLHNEFPNINNECKAELEKVCGNLDADGDGVVTFQEFVSIITDLELMLQLFFSM